MGLESLSNEIADHASSGLPSARSTAISLLMLQGSEPSEPQAFLVRKTITVGSQSQSAKQKRKCAPSARVLGRVPDWNPPQHQAKKEPSQERPEKKRPNMLVARLSEPGHEARRTSVSAPSPVCAEPGSKSLHF